VAANALSNGYIAHLGSSLAFELSVCFAFSRSNRPIEFDFVLMTNALLIA